MTTRCAPASRAATAASNAELPPPITMMSHVSTRAMLVLGLFLGLDAGERHVLLDETLGHSGQLLRDQLLQLGATHRATDRQATPVGLGAILCIVHQALVGLAQDFEPF